MNVKCIFSSHISKAPPNDTLTNPSGDTNFSESPVQKQVDIAMRKFFISPQIPETCIEIVPSRSFPRWKQKDTNGWITTRASVIISQ